MMDDRLMPMLPRAIFYTKIKLIENSGRVSNNGSVNAVFANRLTIKLCKKELAHGRQLEFTHTATAKTTFGVAYLQRGFSERSAKNHNQIKELLFLFVILNILSKLKIIFKICNFLKHVNGTMLIALLL